YDFQQRRKFSCPVTCAHTFPSAQQHHVRCWHSSGDPVIVTEGCPIRMCSCDVERGSQNLKMTNVSVLLRNEFKNPTHEIHDRVLKQRAIPTGGKRYLVLA